ncbi:hypothetical protein PN36_03695 [Candidatus Thiomargarita nelsonii]|uniref:Uncharacterized protein n=1 Tax=Candidatus Thiomargarita nelsonii TaxID=1003181 RepID=A0A4E0R5F9_9GAMM|nr:hypothetical protein PN36_03695 [Candidatus Thiomargarita nelsonii]
MSDLYQRLHEESVSIGQSVEELIQDWLVKRRTISPLNEREQIRDVLRYRDYIIDRISQNLEQLFREIRYAQFPKQRNSPKRVIIVIIS